MASGIGMMAAAVLAAGALAAEPAHGGHDAPAPAPPPAPVDAAPLAPASPDVRRIPAPGGEAILMGPRDEAVWRDLRFAPIRRVGDEVYVSGVVIGPRQGEAHDIAAFKGQTRRAFAYVEAALRAAGLTFADVVRLETFHVFDSPNFDGDKGAQIEAFMQVKDEFLKPPYPAWTAVGVTELVSNAGIVEMRLTARVPAPAVAEPPAAPPKPKPRPRPRPAHRPAAAPEGGGESAGDAAPASAIFGPERPPAARKSSRVGESGVSDVHEGETGEYRSPLLVPRNSRN